MQHVVTIEPSTLSVAFAEALNRFARDLVRRDLAEATQLAYTTDVRQFLTYLEETTVTADSPEKITKADITEYLSHLSEEGVSGITRRRKLASLREFFRFLENAGLITSSPARLVAAAGGHPRDHCILTLFLQLGLRVSELVNLTVSDVDLTERVVIVRNGKGGKDRAIPLEKRSYTALKTYLAHRGECLCTALFLWHMRASRLSRRCSRRRPRFLWAERGPRSPIRRWRAYNRSAWHRRAASGRASFRLLPAPLSRPLRTCGLFLGTSFPPTSGGT
jgi:site-specific recombinase XerD